MNTKAFKRLIKEAVIDAIHEELPFILEEHMAKQEKKSLRENKTMSFTSNDIIPGNPDVNVLPPPPPPEPPLLPVPFG